MSLKKKKKKEVNSKILRSKTSNKKIMYISIFVMLMVITSLFILAGSFNQEKIDENTIVYITNTGVNYHRSNCRYVSHSKIPIRLGDAISRGYTPCSVCHPPSLPNVFISLDMPTIIKR